MQTASVWIWPRCSGETSKILNSSSKILNFPKNFLKNPQFLKKWNQIQFSLRGGSKWSNVSLTVRLGQNRQPSFDDRWKNGWSIIFRSMIFSIRDAIDARVICINYAVSYQSLITHTLIWVIILKMSQKCPKNVPKMSKKCPKII